MFESNTCRNGVYYFTLIIDPNFTSTFFHNYTIRYQLDDPIDAVAVHGGGGKFLNFFVKFDNT